MLVRHLLRQAHPDVEPEWAQDIAAGLDRIEAGGLDACLVDYRLGEGSGLDLIRHPTARASGVPLILLTGAGDRSVDIEAMAAGAADYLDKRGLRAEGLERSLRYAVGRARAERDLRWNEARFRSLIESASDPITILAADGTVRYSSPAIRRVLGLSPDQLVGSGMLERVHPEDRDAVKNVLRQLSENPALQPRIEYRCRHADGSWRVLESVTTHLLDDPAVGGIVVNSRDITKRREAEERVRFQVELLDAVGQAVIATDLEGSVTYMNRAAEDLYGWSFAETNGQSIVDVTPTSASREQAEEILRWLTAGKSWKGEFEVQRRDGTVFPALVTDTPLQDASGALVGIVGVSADISELKRAQEQLREREDQLRQVRKVEALGRLAGGIAHYFNNLLTAVQGYTEILQEAESLDPEERTVALGEILAATQRATGLTQKLLAYSRRQVLRPRLLDLNAVVREMGSLLQSLLGKGIRLETHLGPAVGTVRADRAQIEQIVMNVALNARNAMSGGGRLTLTTTDCDSAPDSMDPGRTARIDIHDDGTGMAPEVLARALEPFFTTREQGQGTGLGLSTVYGFVAQSGGSMRIESEPGRGTVVRIWLPVVEEQPETNPSEEAA